MAASGQYLVFAISIAAQPYAIVAYGIARRRRRGDISARQRSLADTIVGTTVLAAIAPVAYAALLIFSRDEPLVLAIWIGFAMLDLLAGFFILSLMPGTFVIPAILILTAAINLVWVLQSGNPVFILPSIMFSALALRSIRRAATRRN